MCVCMCVCVCVGEKEGGGGGEYVCGAVMCGCVCLRACSMCCVEYSTGWRKPIGCFKLQVIFRKRATNSRALLRKITYKDMASYDSTPPCT